LQRQQQQQVDSEDPGLKMRVNIPIVWSI